MALKDTRWAVTVCISLYWRDLEYGPVVGSCEYGNELLFICWLAALLPSYRGEIYALQLDNKFGRCVFQIVSTRANLTLLSTGV